MPAIGVLGVAFVVFQKVVAAFAFVEARPFGVAGAVATFLAGVLALLAVNSLLVVVTAELLAVGLCLFAVGRNGRAASPN